MNEEHEVPPLPSQIEMLANFTALMVGAASECLECDGCGQMFWILEMSRGPAAGKRIAVGSDGLWHGQFWRYINDPTKPAEATT
jgi:hypothetical protein